MHNQQLKEQELIKIKQKNSFPSDRNDSGNVGHNDSGNVGHNDSGNFGHNDHTKQQKMQEQSREMFSQSFANIKEENRKTTRHRLKLDDQTSTRYQCFCHKQYLSYAALYHHVSKKHYKFFIHNHSFATNNTLQTTHPIFGYKIKKVIPTLYTPTKHHPIHPISLTNSQSQSNPFKSKKQKKKVLPSSKNGSEPFGTGLLLEAANRKIEILEKSMKKYESVIEYYQKTIRSYEIIMESMEIDCLKSYFKKPIKKISFQRNSQSEELEQNNDEEYQPTNNN